MSANKTKCGPSTSRNGLATAAPPDPYRALLETATRDETAITAELATLKPRCEELEQRLSEVSRIREALSGILGEVKAEDARIVFNVGLKRHLPEAAPLPFKEEVRRVLQWKGCPMRAPEVMAELRTLGHKLEGANGYQRVSRAMKDTPDVFRVVSRGLFGLAETGVMSSEKGEWVAEIEAVLGAAEKPMRCANIVRALQKDGHKLHGEAAYQKIYTVLRTNKAIFSHGVSGTWTLIASEAK